MDIVEARTIPLGIPVPLVRDLLDRGVSPAAILAPEGSLLAEYHGARGYAYEWGNVIEARTGSTLAWHFVPVMLWRDTDELRRAQTHTAARLIPELQPEVVAALRERLRRGLVLAGCHPQSRRAAHVLFSLVLAEAHGEPAARRWIAEVFLPETLPILFTLLRARISEICRAHSESSRLHR